MTTSIRRRQKKLRKKPFNQWYEGSPSYWPQQHKAKEKYKVDISEKINHDLV